MHVGEGERKRWQHHSVANGAVKLEDSDGSHHMIPIRFFIHQVPKSRRGEPKCSPCFSWVQVKPGKEHCNDTILARLILNLNKATLQNLASFSLCQQATGYPRHQFFAQTALPKNDDLPCPLQPLNFFVVSLPSYLDRSMNATTNRSSGNKNRKIDILGRLFVSLLGFQASLL